MEDESLTALTVAIDQYELTYILDLATIIRKVRLMAVLSDSSDASNSASAESHYLIALASLEIAVHNVKLAHYHNARETKDAYAVKGNTP